jgi:GT2 family glycosyltransferase/glycosyltransferase involved in cell wall biosynthesis
MWYRIRSLVLLLIMLLFLPVIVVVALALLLANFAYVFTGLTRRRRVPQSAPISGTASIIVLNWNGKELLEEGIPSILKAIHKDGRPHELIVVDNASTDGSVEYLAKYFPEVRVVPLSSNLGFAEGNNAGVQAARNDVVILLNNDMIVDPGFIGPLINGFGPQTFAVTSQIYLQDPARKREETGKTTAVFRRGWIDYAHREMGPPPLPRKYYPVLWAGGGSSAFHRDKFLALGGFQKVFSPAYVEDTDLSYQAWRVGWEVLLAPDSIVYHKHRASTGRRFRPSTLQALVLRNQFIFIWKNIRNWKRLASHCIFLPWNCYRLTRDYGITAWAGFFRAIGSLPAAAAARFRFPFRQARPDHRIFELFAKSGLYFCEQSSDKKFRARRTTTKPRLLWITAYLPHTGRHAGAGRMFQLLTRLSSNYRITLLTFLETDDEREYVSEVAPFCEKVIAMRRTHPLFWSMFAYEPFDEFLTPEMEQAVDHCLEEGDFDLIQLEYTQMACYAKRANGIPALLTKHEVDFAACLRRAGQDPRLLSRVRWFYNYLQVLDREIRLTKKADAVICMTDTDARELHKFCNSVPTYVINTGVDLDYFKVPERPESDPRLVFVGAFQHYPNVEAMTYFCREVLPLVRQKVPGIELYIVGSNPPPVIVSLGDTPGIHVTGFVPDIRPYMAKSLIYVVPLRLGVGIRGKILEAWGMGMAVVSTSVGCAGLRYEDGRDILVADTSDQFVAQILSLLNDPARRHRLGEDGRKTAEQYYGWDKSVQQLEALYQHYLKRRTEHELPPAGEL